MTLRWVLAALIALGVAPPAETQEDAPAVTLRVTASTLNATVGDRLVIGVEVLHPADVVFEPPVALRGEEASLAVEPVKAAVEEGKEKKDLFLFQAQAFETGSVRIPAFQVAWRRSGDPAVSGTARSEPIPVEIASVLKSPQDAPADLKPPAELPAPPFPWRLALVAAAVLAPLVAGLIWWSRRKRPAPAAAPVVLAPALPPHERAYEELQRLLAGSLLREGRVKEFHVELAEIVKRYLAGRFAIETLERTSEEVVVDLRRVRVGNEPLSTAREFFADTDLVKFAKHRPAEDEIRRSVERAYRMIDLTKLVEAPAAGAHPTAPSEASAQGVG